MDTALDLHSALTDDELRRLDAYWRAANYLSVGQIYLLDNPLLREPLPPEHVKPRLLGHWGTTPGLNLLYAHLNRVIVGARPGRHLRHRPRPRRPGHGGEHLAGGHLHASATRRRPRRGRHGAAVPPVLLPRRHPQPRRAGDAGLDPRGRRAGVRAEPRLRRRVRQPGPAGRLRDRRRRGGDRAAGGQLALRTSSSTRPATARCCRSCTSTATRSPTRRCWPGSPRTSCSTCMRGYGYQPYLVAGDDPAQVHQHARRDAGPGAATRSPRSSGGPAPDGVVERPRWPMIVLRTPKGWTGPKRGRRHAGRGHLARPPGAAVGRPRQPGAPGRAGASGCAATGRRSCSTPPARRSAELLDAAAAR